MKTMTVEGVQYVEAPLIKACDGCAFYRRDSCLDIGHAAREAFGESCGSRRVIYIHAPIKNPLPDCRTCIMKFPLKRACVLDGTDDPCINGNHYRPATPVRLYLYAARKGEGGA
jgi:hypothetical protein